MGEGEKKISTDRPASQARRHSRAQIRREKKVFDTGGWTKKGPSSTLNKKEKEGLKSSPEQGESVADGRPRTHGEHNLSQDGRKKRERKGVGRQ